jgi:hypothetical protein
MSTELEQQEQSSAEPKPARPTPASDTRPTALSVVPSADGDPETPVEPSAQLARNCTRDHVIVTSGQRRLHLSPLNEVDVNIEMISMFALRDLSEQHVTRLSGLQRGSGSIESGAIFGIGFWAVIGYFIGLAGIDGPGKVGIGAPIAAILIGLVVVAVLKKRAADVTFALSLAVVFIIGAGAPIAVAVGFGNVDDLFGEQTSPELFGRLTQTLLIVMAALLPTVLYFIFDRQRALTIRRTFQRHILRLDPEVDTIYDVDAKYGDFRVEAIGRHVVSRSKASRSNPYPIFFAAILIVLGWLLVFPVVDRSAASER